MQSSLTRWEPFADLAELRGRLDQMFADLAPRGEHRFTPAIDVVRSDGEIIVRADLPGLKAEDVRIEVDEDILTISGEHAEEEEERDETFVRRERRWGSFRRSMPLPSGVEPEAIRARTHDGVLEVTLPLPEEPERRTVTIKAEED